MNICPYCHTGRLGRRDMVYVQWHGDALLVVDRMPAIICDVCGEKAYDAQAVEHLQRLLWANVPGQLSSALSRLKPENQNTALTGIFRTS